MLKIYNSLTRQIEEFIPKHKNKVNMYVCGPTVYDDIHIGNGRPVVFFDVVKRYLSYLGYEVKYASNITDVDDRIIDRAMKLDMSEEELAKKYANRFLEVVNNLGSNLPDVVPYATDYIDQMIKFIDELVKKDFAYVTNSGVYFRVSKIKDYGILSNQKIDELRKGVRVELESDKEDSADFALWKFTEVGIKYDSPWGEGRPGWHTECVVMTSEIFDDELDIHGGGFDLKFPHHENEIAQSMAHHDHHLSKYWMHVGRLDLANVKMSKSLGNDIKVQSLLTKYSAGAYRLLLLAHGYRNPISFTEELIEQYQKSYDKISYTLNKWNFLFEVNGNKSLAFYEETMNEFKSLMDDDFNTPLVITQLENLNKQLNKTGNYSYFKAMIDILEVLGVKPNINEVHDADINIYKAWNEARVNKDFKTADELRAHLSQKGWI
ncbi:cysteine--tRNA ligase [Acholeplasma hippikon]|uniref:Cysteine--tRNA ligase n=1 Tax=Acholeplasma hippikon TaxID=264636 RepID=A0A449BKF9_9MOLU|nr:cysteine--tRNA ligase [Acholeplasma hippikon]VEU82928.1 Cysteine--tRNA ligase [Acholeplasma hippikon]